MKPYYENPNGYDIAVLKDDNGQPIRRNGKPLYRVWLDPKAPLTLVDRFGVRNRANWDIKVTDLNSMPWIVSLVDPILPGSDPLSDPQPAIGHDDEFHWHGRFVNDPFTGKDTFVPSSLWGANRRYLDGKVANGNGIRGRFRYGILTVGGFVAWKRQYDPSMRRKYGIPDDAKGD